jgi:hypothetical protein
MARCRGGSGPGMFTPPIVVRGGGTKDRSRSASFLRADRWRAGAVDEVRALNLINAKLADSIVSPGF